MGYDLMLIEGIIMPSSLVEKIKGRFLVRFYYYFGRSRETLVVEKIFGYLSCVF